MTIQKKGATRHEQTIQTSHPRSKAKKQIAFARHADLKSWGKYCFHLPNERWNKMEAIRMKQFGVKRGLPDIWIMCPIDNDFHDQGLPNLEFLDEDDSVEDQFQPLDWLGTCIEMKRRNATPSSLKPEQREWMMRLSRSGIQSFVCRGCEEAILVAEYFYGPKCGSFSDLIEKGKRVQEAYIELSEGVYLPRAWEGKIEGITWKPR